jgi:hypothetical protein
MSLNCAHTSERQVFLCAKREILSRWNSLCVFIFIRAKKCSNTLEMRWRKERSLLWKWGWSLEILYINYFLFALFLRCCCRLLRTSKFLNLLYRMHFISISSEKLFTSASPSFFQFAHSLARSLAIWDNKISNKSKFYSTPYIMYSLGRQTKMFNLYIVFPLFIFFRC